ncbi:DUF1569 domain-containing protein [Mucilaginibacter pocheonensis]|uniref:Oxepin-CoA hydrolase/3-oxo-5,6-dehydrosuberyl-CoA semialdehyde dehydrogenase n=1 Tax=Mucilaginibacter pocheonensis TaxID=398050 RepID=A0ABU1TGP6_9SPHI|nr:DUF1569 domain-containing protein [Mucilaginibacter pocheonensis]MDR6944592.1 oxepin-CoA hydrolase/3-oxo-5,6-dehydrosuberyl-CoA semialdehyde dehydrogenase [Mucilaginibacter pocheonensis]
MEQPIDITNRTLLRKLLLSLDENAVPLWGKMKPRQMVEHLVDQVEWTNGKKTPTCDRPAEEAYQSKQYMVYTDAEIPKNVFLENLPDDFKYPDMETAIDQLMKELDDFDQYFKQPGTTAIHGGFGPMNHQEWLIWHGKHFTHHFKQFGLI